MLGTEASTFDSAINESKTARNIKTTRQDAKLNSVILNSTLYVNEGTMSNKKTMRNIDEQSQMISEKISRE